MNGWTVAVAVGVVAVLAGLTGLTVVNATRWLRRPVSAAHDDVTEPVSILLPLRDEADRVTPCLRALRAQRQLADWEIVVLDDGSSDGTADVVADVAGADPRVRLLTGVEPPPGWLGKPHACHQLAEAATAPGRAGGVLVFVDADVVLAPHAVAAAVRTLRAVPAQLLSPYPRIVADGAGQRLVQPLLQWTWLTFLPLRAMERSPRTSLAAAGGQFLVVDRAAYRRAGGHAAVRDQVLEDIGLARAVKRTGGRIALADGSGLADCRMYGSWRELSAGYTKSLWASLPSPIGAAAVVGALTTLYVLPLLLALTGLGALVTGLGPAGPAAGLVGAGFTGYALGVAGRVVAARATGGRGWPDGLAHPVSVALLGWLVIRSYHLRNRRRLSWRGRPVTMPPTAGP
ncbi:glycosyltransferase family 2 protein [Solwaraspora sp. WMMD406]|uniref:glycosyltransferase n=1 Tax=Solwaraspora sp. WMMD406 TaxID=3016095 RepID=UPI00241642DD|nr:glycosyltransferase family 2 protein [Solwaraspora sp. WMMD406]MDG4765207.1 glycosyltransferase family 2 protein [Solwaraspora sp. WMMD406]